MKIFITDGSSECFYTAVFYAFKQRDAIITSDENVQLTFDSEVTRVECERDKSERVCAKIRSIDRHAESDIDLMLRSCDALREQTAFEYVKLLVLYSHPVKNMLSLPAVLEANRIIDGVRNETHRFTGFLRFMETEQGILYAPYSPDNDVTDLLMPHFTARFKNEKFVIHDLLRKYAAMYDGNDWISGEAGEAEVYLSQYEKSFETLWKKYYSAVNIESRRHVRQMKGYMPVRYWKFLPEKSDM